MTTHLRAGGMVRRRVFFCPAQRNPGHWITVAEQRSRGVDLLLTFLISLVTSAAVLFVLGPTMLRSQGLVPGAMAPAPVSEPAPKAATPPPAAQAPKLTAPNLEGLDIEAARERVRKSGIAVIEDGERQDSSAKPGEIVEQNPAPGAQLEQQEIRVIVAGKPSKVEIPDVIGQTEGDARKALEDAGFEVPDEVELEVPDADVDPSPKAGTVSKVSPEAGEEAPEGSIVRLTVVKDTVVVPRVLHKSLKSATKKIEGAGLELGTVSQREHPELSGRKVLSQDPDPGEKVQRGTKVDLVIVAPD